MGEGWHNNHHRYAAAARQGFFWWEVDTTYYVLRVMARLGLIRDLRPPPRHVLDEGRTGQRTEELTGEVQPADAAPAPATAASSAA